jgi:hypothetical protein
MKMCRNYKVRFEDTIQKKEKHGTTENTEGKLIKKLCELFSFLNQKRFSLKRIHSERKSIEILA